MDNFARRLETITNNQMEMLDLENKITKIRNSRDQTQLKTVLVNWRIGNRNIENLKQIRRMENIDMRARKVQDTLKWSNIPVTGIQMEKKWNGGAMV